MQNLKLLNKVQSNEVFENGDNLSEAIMLKLDYRHYIEVLNISDSRDDSSHMILTVIDCGTGENTLNNHKEPMDLDNEFYEKQKTIVEEHYKLLDGDYGNMRDARLLLDRAMDLVTKK